MHSKKKDPLNRKIQAAIDLLLEGGADLSTIFAQDGLLKVLTKNIVERALASEMEDHLGYSKHSRTYSDNSRNGSYNKSLTTDQGEIALDIPRDRSGTFEPMIIPKYQRRIDGLDQKILSLYAKGMSLSDIKIQLEELYGATISESLISKITDNVMDEVLLWQNRPLESVYAIVYLDCLVVKVKQDKRIINKSVYVALGIELSGKKDILGLWISENEGAKFWLSNLTELKNRGLNDILITCTDNLVGISDAIGAVYPKTGHQLCIVHQIRNSLQYVSYKDRKKVVSDLQSIYKATSEEEAHNALHAFDTKWSKRYPHIAKSWYSNWDNLILFLEYPESIRRVIYTTNAVESANSQFRKTTKNKRVFPNDNAVFKILYLTITYMTKKWTMPIQNWNEAMAHFMIKFEGRM